MVQRFIGNLKLWTIVLSALLLSACTEERLIPASVLNVKIWRQGDYVCARVLVNDFDEGLAMECVPYAKLYQYPPLEESR